MIHIPDDWEAGFGSRAGFLDIESALNAFVRCARNRGVELLSNTPVISWGASNQGVWVTTAEGRFDGNALIITAGPWAARVLEELRLPLTIQRKVQWWFEVQDAGLYALDRFQIFFTDSAAGEIYGFPIFRSPGMKVGNHSSGLPTDPDLVNRSVTDDEKLDVGNFASSFFQGVTTRVLDYSVCLYSRTPDENFILDRHGEWPNVVVGAGFSGHGFKFAPAIGEHLVSLALDRNERPRDIFRLSRFQI
jgi:glycine/D-amino acid oxidase-like deaminating enzyme